MNELIRYKVKQGSEEWHALREKFPKSASMAGIMMGVSPYMTRTDMLNGFKEKPGDFLKKLFKKGHEVEALTRDLLEEDIEDGLYPFVGSRNDLLASLDGITLSDNRIIFECKLWNESLAKIVESGRVPDSHKWQLVQQQFIFDCNKTIFVVTDGTKEKWVQTEFTATQQDVDDLLAGWMQFDKDISTHVPEIKLKSLEVAKREVNKLPEIIFDFKGEITLTSNINTAKEAILAKIDKDKGLICDISTHVYFSDAIKDYSNNELRLKEAKERAIKSNLSVAKFIEIVDFCYDNVRAERLSKARQLKRFKDNFNIDEISKRESQLLKHISDSPISYELIGTGFEKAIKGKSNLDNKISALDAELARCKVVANKLIENHAKNSAFAAKYAAGLNTDGIDFTLPIDDFNPKINLLITQENERLQREKNVKLEATISEILSFPKTIMPTLNQEGLSKWLEYYQNYNFDEFGSKAPQALSAVNSAISAINRRIEIQAILDSCADTNRPDLFDSAINKLDAYEEAAAETNFLKLKKEKLLKEIEESHAEPIPSQPYETTDEYMSKKSGTFHNYEPTLNEEPIASKIKEHKQLNVKVAFSVNVSMNVENEAVKAIVYDAIKNVYENAKYLKISVV